MAKKLSISTIYLALTLILSTLIVLMVGATMMFIDNRKHNEMVDLTSERISNQLKETMVARVKQGVTLVEHVHLNSEDFFRKQLKKQVRKAHQQASLILSQNADLPLSTQKDLITDTLRPIRFNFGHNVINVVDVYGELQLLPDNISYEGHSLQKLQKLKSQNIVSKERLQQLTTIITQTKKEGEFFIESSNTPALNNPNNETIKTIEFFKYLEPLDWIIGTSGPVDHYEKETKKLFIDIISPMKYEAFSKLFIMDYDQKILIAPEERRPSKGSDRGTISAENHAVFAKAVKLAQAKENEVIKTKWFNQNTQQYEPVLLYFELAPNWKWFIGRLVNLTDLDKEIGLNKSRLRDQLEDKFAEIAVILIIAYAITLVIALLIYRKINWHFKLFINHLQHVTHDNLPFEKERISITEFDLLAHTMNEQLEKRLALQLKLEELAQQDPLTDLYNRRKMDELLDIEVSRVKRNNRPFSVVMCDIDNFKRVNDTYGHETGDKVIVAVADILRQSLRQQDFISRWGGEEFLIALPDTTIEQAVIVSEKIRKSCEETIVSNAGHNIHFTMTFGIDIFDNSKDIKATIAAADTALYEGKQTGRNLVTCFKNL